MNVPSGYTALDLVGFTDKGTYSSSSNYVRNDLVHYQGKIWKCKVDDTTNVTPTEGAKWTVWVNSVDKVTDLTDVNISSASNNQVLGYNSTASKWENKTLANVARTGAASDVTYNNAQSGLSATNVKGAIDEVSSDIATLSNYVAENNVKNLFNIYGEKAAQSVTSVTIESNGFRLIQSIATEYTNMQMWLRGLNKNTDYVFFTNCTITSGHPLVLIDNSSGTTVGRLHPPTAGANVLNFNTGNDTDFKFYFYCISGIVETGEVLYADIMVCEKAVFDTDPTYQPYAKPNTELTADTTGLTANAFVNGAVNLLKNTLITRVDNGVAFIHNSDGTVTANGTATANCIIEIGQFTDLSNVILSGCPSGGDLNSTYNLQLRDVTTSTWGEWDLGNGAQANGLDATHTYSVYLIVRSGYTASNKVFKPMITVADMPNSDYAHYVPYAKSNKELTAEMSLFSNAIGREITAATAWSDLENMGTYVMNGVPFTGNWSIVLVLKRNENTGVQIAFKVGSASDVSSNYVAYRMYYSGAWSNWSAVNATNMT